MADRDPVPSGVLRAQEKFEAARAKYESFRAQHESVVAELDALAVEMNVSLEVLRKEIKTNWDLIPHIGDFKVTPVIELDPDTLIQRLGHDTAKAFLKTKYTVDRQAYNQGLSMGVITPEDAAHIERFGTPRITGPKPVDIYQR